MFRDMTPVGIMQDSMAFWCRAAHLQLEFNLRLWKAMGAPGIEAPRILVAPGLPAATNRGGTEAKALLPPAPQTRNPDARRFQH